MNILRLVPRTEAVTTVAGQAVQVDYPGGLQFATGGGVASGPRVRSNNLISPVQDYQPGRKSTGGNTSRNKPIQPHPPIPRVGTRMACVNGASNPLASARLSGRRITPLGSWGTPSCRTSIPIPHARKGIQRFTVPRARSKGAFVHAEIFSYALWTTPKDASHTWPGAEAWLSISIILSQPRVSNRSQDHFEQSSIAPNANSEYAVCFDDRKMSPPLFAAL